jgi:hypothetical protein
VSDHPRAALDAAAVALHDADCPDRHCEPVAMGAYYASAQRVLDAAGPHILAEAAARLKAAIAGEATAICTETALEAVATERARLLALLGEHSSQCSRGVHIPWSVIERVLGEP